MNLLSNKLTLLDKIVFVVLIVFTLLGVALTNMSPGDAHKYWLLMTLVFAIAAIVTGWNKTNDKSEKIKLIMAQLFHWSSTLVAILVVYAFLHSGQIENEMASLVILLVLALSSFLDGLQTGWHFFVIGILLAISAVVISYVDEFLWVIAAIAIVLLVISYYWNKFKEKQPAIIEN